MTDYPSPRTGRPPGPPKGNQNAKKHGAEAQVPAERLNAKAREVYDALAEDAPVRDAIGDLPRHDREIVVLLARALCRLEDVTTWLDEHGTFTRQGRLRSRVLAQEERLRGETMRYLQELGMTPRARAKLGVDLAHTQSLASRMAEADVIDVETDDD